MPLPPAAHAASSFQINPTQQVLYAEGNSITAGSAFNPSVGFPSLMGIAKSNISVFNNAVSGSTVGTAVGRVAALDAQWRTGFVLFVNFGYIDLVGSGTVQNDFLTPYQNYIDARIAVGWIVYVGTVLPSTTVPGAGGTFETRRVTANNAIRSWLGGRATKIIDFAADPTVGPAAAASDMTLFLDGIHPTAACNSVNLPAILAAGL